MNRRFAFFDEQWPQPLDQLALSQCRRVPLADLKMPGQHVAQQAVGMQRAARVRTARQQPAGPKIQRLLELGE